MDRLTRGYDGVILIDGNDANPLGPVGLGKTRFSIMTAEALHPGWDMEEFLVVKDDIPHFRFLMENPSGVYCEVIVLDEAQWFVFNEWHGYRDVKFLIPYFEANRKEGGGRVWILNTPTIWKCLDWFIHSRVQWRVRVEKRDGPWVTATVFERSSASTVVPKKDAWGLGVTEVHKIPEVPPDVWEKYEDLIAEHVHSDECASRIRG